MKNGDVKVQIPFSHIIGTGGIGSGMFFELEGMHTLGRNESRAGKKLDVRDHCKLHIIFHYIAKLLAGRDDIAFRAHALGMVGNDGVGETLLQEMDEAGIDTACVKVADAATLFSVCFQYPDSSGANVTTSNGASSLVSAEYIRECFQKEEAAFSPAGEMVMAVPEVPLEARLELLRVAKARGAYTVASILSGEAAAFYEKRGFELVDLLAVNIDEAQAIAQLEAPQVDDAAVVQVCAGALQRQNPAMKLVVTNGKKGCWVCRGESIVQLAPITVKARSTAGAGDAFLAGVITGLCCGLALAPEESAPYSLREIGTAAELGTLTAAFSVLAADTIHTGFSGPALAAFAQEHGIPCSETVKRILA